MYLVVFAQDNIIHVDIYRCLFLHIPIPIICLFILQMNERCYLMKRLTDTVTHTLHDWKNQNPFFVEVIYFLVALVRELRNCVSIIRIVYWADTLSSQNTDHFIADDGGRNISVYVKEMPVWRKLQMVLSVPYPSSNRPLLFLSWMVSNCK